MTYDVLVMVMVLGLAAVLGGYVGFVQGRYLTHRDLRADVARLTEEIDTREKAEESLKQLVTDLSSEVNLAKMQVANASLPRRRTA